MDDGVCVCPISYEWSLKIVVFVMFVMHAAVSLKCNLGQDILDTRENDE